MDPSPVMTSCMLMQLYSYRDTQEKHQYSEQLLGISVVWAM